MFAKKKKNIEHAISLIVIWWDVSQTKNIKNEIYTFSCVLIEYTEIEFWFWLIG